MKCYNHTNIDAVGACKQCNKGICHLCASDLGHGLACKDKHEGDVNFLNDLIDRSRKTIAIQPKSTIVGNLSWLFMSLIFIGFGFYREDLFLKIFGIMCGTYWIYFSIYNSFVFKELGSNT